MASHTAVDMNYGKVMNEKRLAILDHIIGVCEFPNNEFYKRCRHEQYQQERLDPGECLYLHTQHFVYLNFLNPEHSIVVAALTINHTVSSSSPACANLTKSSQQAFNPKLLGLSDLDLNLEAPCTTLTTWAR